MVSATASAFSKFDNFSDEHINSLIDDATLKNTKKATASGILVLKGKFVNLKIFIQTS